MVSGCGVLRGAYGQQNCGDLCLMGAGPFRVIASRVTEMSNRYVIHLKLISYGMSIVIEKLKTM